MDLQIGIFCVPDATDPASTLEQALAAERSGLDLIGIQDHPYQRRFFETWTLLSYLAARTERLRLVPDVANLQLRLASMTAKTAASLDVLSGGRVELGVGAGSFWEGIEAMGGRRPKSPLGALEEAIAILRAFWSEERSVRVEGRYHRASGAKPGPPPAHPIGIWVGAYGPRMLELTGRLGDGWLPSLGAKYMSAEDAPDMQRAVDEGARAAGRDPAEIVRAANVMAPSRDPAVAADELARIATELGFTVLFVGVPDEDPVGFVRRLGEEVAPRARELLG